MSLGNWLALLEVPGFQYVVAGAGNHEEVELVVLVGVLGGKDWAGWCWVGWVGMGEKELELNVHTVVSTKWSMLDLVVEELEEVVVEVFVEELV